MNPDTLKEEVIISYTTGFAIVKGIFYVSQAKVFVVNSARNRFIGDFDSIDEAVVHALNKGFKIASIQNVNFGSGEKLL